MCNPDSIGSTTAGQNRSLLMLSVKSFSGHGGVPSTKAQITTMSFVLLFLAAVEQSLRVFFFCIKDFHPILDDETNRNILARHVGVDALSCFVVSYCGWKARHIVQDVVDATIGRKPNAMPAAYEKRIFTYYPEVQRIVVFFTAFQIKNTVDTIIWNDGLLYIMHHILALGSAWGGLFGNFHFYALFYFGVSEFSTGVLCLLANFDDEHGVVGLGAAFPMVKVGLGGFFAFLFVICRVVMWSTMTYYCCRDLLSVMKGNDPKKKGFELWFKFTFVSLSLLSLLQIIWLFDIFKIGMEELEKIGLL